MNRRDFLGMTTHAVAVSSLAGNFAITKLFAQSQTLQTNSPSLHPPLKPMSDEGRVVKTWISPKNCYFCYPHANGFIPETGELLLGQEVGETIHFLAWDFKSGKTRPIYNAPKNHFFFDMSEESGEMFLILNRKQVVVIQTKGDPKPQVIYEHDKKLVGMISTSHDGRKVLLTEPFQAAGEKVPSLVVFYEFDRVTQKATKLFEVNFFGNHQMYSPYDPNWIGFCHEGDISQTFDRVWGWKRTANLPPQCLWDEKGANSGMLLAGHERWLFHKLGAIAIAYPSSTGSPRGLYFINPEKRSGTLISESNCDWHCNVDRAGTWAIVDTIGPWRNINEGISEWKDCQGISDIVLVHMPTGKRFWLARSHLKIHPWHPHPHFTPDGKYVVYNDYQNDSTSNPCTVVMEIKYPAVL